MKVLDYAPDAFRYLKGLFCIYKPSGVLGPLVKRTLVRNMIRDLNEMETRPVNQIVCFNGAVASGKPLAVTLADNFADHPLTVGPRYQHSDVWITPINLLGLRMSGVQLFYVNSGGPKLKAFKEDSHLQVLEVKGRFGMATDTSFEDGKVLEKATYRQLRQSTLDRVLASIQATQQAEAFKVSGIHIESQEAYNLASQGIVKPDGQSVSLIYDMSCTEFNLPDFTLKIHCINQSDELIAKLVHEIGLYMKSCAVCITVRQIQFGNFMTNHALLRKHWTLEHVISNIRLCQDIFELYSKSSSKNLIKPVSRKSIDDKLHVIQNEARMDVIDRVME